MTPYFRKRDATDANPLTARICNWDLQLDLQLISNWISN